MTKNNSYQYNNINRIFLLIYLIVIVFIFKNTLITMIYYLYNNDDYSYGLLLPLVSGYIIYKKWPYIQETSIQPSWWGAVILIGGLTINIIGELAADLYLPRVSFIISLFGILTLLGGWQLLRRFIFPLFLIFLMIPLPQLITLKLTLPMQLISSQLAAGILQVMGIPTFRQGNIIDLGVRQMQIVDACSGLRYILALLALGVIFCYFHQRNPWKIIILLIVLIPATIFANALRVAAMGVFPILLEGFWHAFSGWLIFIFCFGILAAVNYFLNRLSSPEKIKTSNADLDPPPNVAKPKDKTNYWVYVVAGAVIILISIPITQRASYAPNYPLKEGFEDFPMTIDSWKGRHVHLDPDMVAATRSHAHLNAEYTNPDKSWVSLWIAYYETQKKAGGFVHSPKGCFTASGWEIEKSKIIDIAEGKPVNWMVVNRTGEKLLVYYWFSQRGRWLADETKNKFYMAYDGFFRRRTDGALIRLITPIGGNIETAQQRLTLFAKELEPLLNKYIPK
jgi:exosortase D (VPLPA-CTERM-specific)